MGALFSAPELPPAPPTPPPPPEPGDVAVQNAVVAAQQKQMSMLGYKSAFKAGARGEGGPVYVQGGNYVDTSASPGNSPQNAVVPKAPGTGSGKRPLTPGDGTERPGFIWDEGKGRWVRRPPLEVLE